MDFYITVLGSSAAIPTVDRQCSSQLANVCGYRVLLDCGEGVQLQLRRCHQRLLSINLICITHLHGDHFFGLPGLISTMHLCGRTHPLTIIGPQGLKTVLDTLFTASATQLAYPLTVVELSHDGELQVFENSHCRITAFPLWHSVPTYGYRIDQKTKGNHTAHSYAYCTDTGLNEKIIDYVAGVDMLCLECTFDDDLEAIAKEKQHLTLSNAADLARRAGAGQLLLTHFSARYRDIQPLEKKAQTLFTNTFMATDGVRYKIGKNETLTLLNSKS